MNINGINGLDFQNTAAVYANSRVSSAETAEKTEGSKEAKEAKAAEQAAAQNAAEQAGPQSGPAAVYEPSTKSINEMDESERKALVSQLKADTETRLNNLTNLVWKMIGKQSATSEVAQNGSLDENSDIWNALRTGNVKVDAATQKEAQEAISEDGYWGVKQTSDRLFKFAVALAGDDPSKIDTMIDAFKKGYDEAEKAWGGKLPQIAQDTRDAVMQKFEDYKKQNGILAE